VAPRVSPTETIRAELHELFSSGGELLSVIEQVARLSVRLTFQSVVEEIVCEELGRGRYQRRTADSPEGYRNGWQQPRTLKTSLGPVQLQRPSCATRRRRCVTSCSARASAGPTRWRPWSSHSKGGAVFLGGRRPSRPVAGLDLDPASGRARLSYRRAAERFHVRTGWTLHQLRHSALTHAAEDGTNLPLLLARSRHASVRSLERYARPGPEAVARHLADTDPARRRP
jgi:hypothetical protein